MERLCPRGRTPFEPRKKSKITNQPTLRNKAMKEPDFRARSKASCHADGVSTKKIDTQNEVSQHILWIIRDVNYHHITILFSLQFVSYIFSGIMMIDFGVSACPRTVHHNNCDTGRNCARTVLIKLRRTEVQELNLLLNWNYKSYCYCNHCMSEKACG